MNNFTIHKSVFLIYNPASGKYLNRHLQEFNDPEEAEHFKKRQIASIVSRWKFHWDYNIRVGASQYSTINPHQLKVLEFNGKLTAVL